MTDVTAVIPTIPPRSAMLARAIRSVMNQTHPVSDLIIPVDHKREGAAVNRQRGTEMVNTEFLIWVDDDDELMPHHVETLIRAQQESGADIVWPWFRVQGGTDPFPGHQGRQWNPDEPHQFPITVLLRTEAFRQVGGFETVLEGTVDKDGHRIGEDLKLWIELSDAGFSFHHIPDVTWIWNHWGGNLSGLPNW